MNSRQYSINKFIRHANIKFVCHFPTAGLAKPNNIFFELRIRILSHKFN